MGSNPTRALKDWPADGRAEGVTEQGLVQSAGPNVQLASTSLQGRPVSRWRRGHALAGAPMATAGFGALRRQRLCLRLRGADPAFHLFPRGRSSDEQSARLSGERPPVRVRSSPLRGGRGVDGSTRGCDPRWRRFEPGRPPHFRADAEHRRAQRAVTPSPLAVVVRLHPSALVVQSPRGCSSTGRAPRLQRGRCRFDSDRLHFASVVSTANTRPLYGRGAGSTPAGGSFIRP